MTASESALAAVGLRERKKLMTRQALIDSAQRLFEQRGYDNVTVAEIADAANIAVKTLFTYFASKEDLAFADEGELRAELADAIKNRSAGQSPLDVTLAVATRHSSEQTEQAGQPGQGAAAGLEGFRRGYGESAALANRLRRMWADYEDMLTEAIASSPAPGARVDAATARLQAMQLVLVIRYLTTPEAAAVVANAKNPAAALRRCLKQAGHAASAAFTGQ